MRGRRLQAILIASLLATPVAAQMGVHGSPASHAPFGRRPSYRPGFYLGSPFLADDYSPQYAQPPVFVLQIPAQAAPKPSASAEDPKPLTPLMIEWQGDHYVRKTSDAASDPAVRPRDYSEPAAPLSAVHPRTVSPAVAHTEPPPALFVFRDGHHEESSDYSIISGVIYARGEYWTNGYWSKQIPLAQLDLPATLKANQERGLTFRLPSAPNEVITRP